MCEWWFTYTFLDYDKSVSNSAVMQIEWWRLKWDRTELGIYSGKIRVSTTSACHYNITFIHKFSLKRGNEIDKEVQTRKYCEKKVWNIILVIAVALYRHTLWWHCMTSIIHYDDIAWHLSYIMMTLHDIYHTLWWHCITSIIHYDDIASHLLYIMMALHHI